MFKKLKQLRETARNVDMAIHNNLIKISKLGVNVSPLTEAMIGLLLLHFTKG